MGLGPCHRKPNCLPTIVVSAASNNTRKSPNSFSSFPIRTKIRLSQKYPTSDLPPEGSIFCAEITNSAVHPSFRSIPSQPRHSPLFFSEKKGSDPMADEIVINGIGREAEDNTADDEDGSDPWVVELTRKFKSLEFEKSELARENDEAKERNRELMIEIARLKGEGEDMRATIEEMRVEIELVEEGRRAMDSIMKRAVDLEKEVSRLQHDLISAMHEVEEVNRDADELRRVVEEKEKKVGGLEIEVEGLKEGKEESETRVRDLVKKVRVSEARESDWESEKVKSEMELCERLEEKEGLVMICEKKVETLEAELGKIRAELENVKKDKTVLGDALKESEEKVKKLEKEMIKLQRDRAVAETVEIGSKENARNAVKGKCLVGMKEHWHFVAVGSAGAVAAASLMAHVYFSGRRS